MDVLKEEEKQTDVQKPTKDNETSIDFNRCSLESDLLTKLDCPTLLDKDTHYCILFPNQLTPDSFTDCQQATLVISSKHNISEDEYESLSQHAISVDVDLLQSREDQQAQVLAIVLVKPLLTTKISKLQLFDEAGSENNTAVDVDLLVQSFSQQLEHLMKQQQQNEEQDYDKAMELKKNLIWLRNAQLAIINFHDTVNRRIKQIKQQLSEGDHQFKVLLIQINKT